MHICTPANTLKTALLRLIPTVAESLTCCKRSFNSAFGQGWITVQTLSQGLCHWLAEYGRPALFVLAAAVLDSDPLYDTVSESKFGSEHTNSYQFHFQNFPRVFREFSESFRKSAVSEKFGSLKFSCLTRSKVAAAKAWERGWITNGKWLVSSVIKWLDHVCESFRLFAWRWNESVWPFFGSKYECWKARYDGKIWIDMIVRMVFPFIDFIDWV